MAIERVLEYFRALGKEELVMQFDTSSATVKEAAMAIGCTDAEIAKTMSFSLDGQPILIVTAGDKKIDNQKFKARFHTKAKMLSPDELVELVGHEIGGVCPFAVKDGCKVYLDESLKRFATVYPAAGNARSAVRLSLSELEEYSGFSEYVDVCRDIISVE